MDISQFKAVLSSFADEPTDVDMRLGRIVAELRGELIDVRVSYKDGDTSSIIIHENEDIIPARTWIINRIARLPQLADRILASPASQKFESFQSAFVSPRGEVTRDVVEENQGDQEVDARESLLDVASNPIPGATSVFYLTSDAGEGKTTLIAKVAQEQARRFKEKKVSSLIVPIPLGGKAFLTFDDAVIAALVNKLRFPYLYFEAFINLVKMGLVVPAFDGYEEMLVEGDKGEAVSSLGGLVQSLDSAGTIILSARKAFFEYVSFKTQAKLLDAIGDRSAVFGRLSLARWGFKEFITYGTRRNRDDVEDIYHLIEGRLGGDHPLLTRAVLVKRLFDVLEKQDGAEVVALLGANPSDYFYTFVNAIVKREAEEKWLDKDLVEPLLAIEDHHALLSSIALEMWQTSSISIRYDLLDVVVDIFLEGRKKSASQSRQIKERVRQHSLLAVDSARSNAVSFDHEDFQSFYLGEALGELIFLKNKSEIRSFLAVGIVPIVTVEQSIQSLIRRDGDLVGVLSVLQRISSEEHGFTFTKENCGALVCRLLELVGGGDASVDVREMIFPVGGVSGKVLSNINFYQCHFQPTAVSRSKFENVKFEKCEFERLELEGALSLQGCCFKDSQVDSIVFNEVQSFDPGVIRSIISEAGGDIKDSSNGGVAVNAPPIDDERFKILEKFLRFFMRSTYMDETFIRLRLGKISVPLFMDEMLGELIDADIVDEVPWKGQGVQRRYKLKLPMSDIAEALEGSGSTFGGFIKAAQKILSKKE
ncbi:hypothetical protein [uncultured Xanthomonas sp.]|uniref:hypothetical protein n=1 Tax=uncultured Xanthomonas sp. TaxID=152831 RepID=UPI0025F8E6D3|nr:hypothetical protein [uncultured Xanthomonas sp.]